MKQIYSKLLKIIYSDLDSFSKLIKKDNTLGLNVSQDEILNFLEFSDDDNPFLSPIVGNIIITEGDVLSVLKVISALTNYEGTYTLYINEDNICTNTFFVRMANMLYLKIGVNVKIKVNYNKNYNNYLDEMVTIIGSDNFVNCVKDDFKISNQIII